jgi:hypothetical protein
MLFRIPGETSSDENGEPFVEPQRRLPEPPPRSWAAYVQGHPERLPRMVSTASSDTWADVAPGEYRRVTRNWRRWQARRRRS